MSNPVAKDIDDYIAEFPQEIQKILVKVRSTIHAAAPEALEAIKYRMPTFTLHGNLVHFAVLKNHIGFYPTPSGIDNFKNELKGLISTKGAIQFPINQPLPYDTITKMVKFRVEENVEKAKAKKK